MRLAGLTKAECGWLGERLAGGTPGWGPESLQHPEAAWGPQEDQEDGLEAKTTVQRKHDVLGEYLMLWGNVHASYMEGWGWGGKQHMKHDVNSYFLYLVVVEASCFLLYNLLYSLNSQH